MKIGVFLPTTNNGYIYSKTSPQFMPSYALNRQVCVDAEQTGFEFALSMVKYRGYGDGDGFWDYSVESTSIMGPLVEATSRLKLWASIGAPSIHPAMAARMAATLDDASGGRFGYNIVAGWNEAEYSQMGLWPGGSYGTERWKYVEEYVSIMRGLWETGRYTHHGQFFDVEDCLLQPRPTHDITVIVPGQSANTLALAARQADVNFILGTAEDMGAARRGLLAETAKTGRTVESSGLLGVVAAETDAEAVEMAMDWMRNVDVQAQQGLVSAASGDTSGNSSKRYLEAPEPEPITFDHPDRAAVVWGSCWFTHHIVGSYDRVAAYLDALDTEHDIASTVLCFPDYTTDVRSFGENVLPRMKTVDRVLV